MRQRIVVRRCRFSYCHPATIALLLTVAVLFVSGSASAQTTQGVSRAQKQDYGVAMSGDYAIVGAQWHDGFNGAAYILRRSGNEWLEEQKLSPAVLEPCEHFGASVAIDGDYAAVGATWHDSFRGAVYVFERVGNEWMERQILTSGAPAPDQRFGTTVRVDGEWITVGCASAGPRGAHQYTFPIDGGIWKEGEKTTVAGAEITEDSSETDALDFANRLSFVLGGQPPNGQVIAAVPPDTVRFVSATDGAYEDRVEISWASTGLSAIVYRVLRDGALLSVVSSMDSLYIDYTGTPGVVYDYCVVVRDMYDVDSDPKCDSGSRIIFAPEEVAASDGEFDQFVRVIWSDMSLIESGFEIRRDGAVIDSTDANAQTYDDSTAAAMDLYTYEVRAFDDDGNVSEGNSDQGMRGLILPPLQVLASDGQYTDHVEITWIDQALNEDGYIVSRNGAPLDTTGADVEFYTDMSASYGETYLYCVTTSGKDATSAPVVSIPACDEGGRGILPAPTNVSATDSTLDDGVEITWNDPSDLESGFEIWRGAELIGTVVADQEHYKDESAPAGVPLEYCVVAYSDSGGHSNGVCDIGFRSMVLAPTDVSASDGTHENRVEISWNSSSTTAGLYKIFRDDTFIVSVNTGERTYSDYGGAAGQEYTYSVVAVTSMDAVSDACSDMGSRELRSPEPVEAGDEEHEEKVLVSWADRSLTESGYIVVRENTLTSDVDTLGTKSANSTSFSDFTAVPGATYMYRVAAFDDLGEKRGYSEPAGDLGRRVLGAPYDVSATDGDFEDRVEITWIDNCQAEDGFHVYRDGVQISSVPDNHTSFVDMCPPSPILTGTYDTAGEAKGVAVSGYHAYVADMGHGLVVVDISDPTALVLAGSYDTAGEANGVTVSGDHAYVADMENGLVVVDISDPTTPTLAGSYTTAGSAWDVAVSGDYAYVTDYENGLVVVDISDPTTPTLVGSYAAAGNVMGVVVSGNHAYVANRYNGILILDISDPTTPTLVGSYDSDNSAWDVAVSGDYAYVADYREDLVVVDISDPTAPTFAGRYTTAGYPIRVEVRGSYAYVADYGNGLVVVDISDPTTPTLAGGYDTAGHAFDVAVSGDYAYVADEDNGLVIVDVGGPIFKNSSSLVLAGSYDTAGEANGVTVSGDHAYVADMENGLVVLDISNPTTPTLAGSYTTAGSAWDVAVSGDYAYVTDYENGLVVMDISDPTAPTFVGSYAAAGNVMGVVVSGNHAYVANRYNGILILDISDPTTPALAGSYDTDNSAWDVAVSGDYAYVADYREDLVVVDISDPTAPTFAGRYTTAGYPIRVEVRGSYAYVADYGNGLVVVDISDPTTPTLAGGYDTAGHAFDVAVSGDYAYVADEDNGLVVVDISDPTTPTLAGSYDTAGEANGVAVSGYHAYVADGGNGLVVVDVSLRVTVEYAVRAYDAYGESEPGVEGSYDTGFTSILAPGYLNASDTYTDRVELVWVDMSSIESEYIIKRDGVVIDSTSATSYTDNTAAEGVTYEYCVLSKWWDATCTEAVYSAPVCDDGLRPAPAEGPSASPWPPGARLSNEETNYEEGFWHYYYGQGAAVAVEGETVISTGIWQCGEPVTYPVALVWEKCSGGWCHLSHIKPYGTPGNALDGYPTGFGASVALQDGVAIIGAPTCEVLGSDEKGTVYVFERSIDGTWPENETQELMAEVRHEGDRFGHAVAMDNGAVVIGAPGEDDGSAIDAGAVYIFTKSTGGWVQYQKLVQPDDPSLEIEFGSSVDISGDMIIAAGNRSESAYIFERDSGGDWVFKQSLPVSGGAGAVAVDGDLALVSAPDSDAGKVFAYERDSNGNWFYAQTMQPSGYGSAFGNAISLDGTVAIIGDMEDYEINSHSGAAYIFARDAGGVWRDISKMHGKNGDVGDSFGFSVAVDGDVAVCGAVSENYLFPFGYRNVGAAYACEFVARPKDVAASDGTFNSRVRVRWDDQSSLEDGFRIYRDGELIADVQANREVYDDNAAQAGRAYKYDVQAYSNTSPAYMDLGPDYDHGWRSPDGNITGRISTPSGAPVESVLVCLEPAPERALLLDGTGGRVRTAKHGATYYGGGVDFTLELWCNYTGSGGTGGARGVLIFKGVSATGKESIPFVLSNMRNSGDPGRLVFAMHDGTNAPEVESGRDDLNDGAWHHVACVHDAGERELRIYVDGVLDGTAPYSSLLGIIGHYDLMMGSSDEAGSCFGGRLDEVRIWSIARTGPEIRATMTKPLTGEEPGLVDYWPLDGGVGDLTIDMTADASYGILEGGAYWSGEGAPLEVCVQTDMEGNYSRDGVRYGEETTFKVRPHNGGRQFSPVFRMITLNPENPVENQVDFFETTMYTVSGTVMFAGYNCPVPDVEIYVDGKARGTTDKRGKFSVAVSQGKHWFTPRLGDHTFSPDSLRLDVVDDRPNVDFEDATVRNLSGRVGGGCDLYIGRLTIEYNSENNCFSGTVKADSLYSLSLPPQKYYVSAPDIELSTIPDGLDKADVVEFFRALGTREVDLTAEDAELDFKYRGRLHVYIRGLDPYRMHCPLTFEERTLPENLPVVEQLEVLDLTIEVGELYGRDDEEQPIICPLDSGKVVVYDEIFDKEDEPVEIVIRNGMAEYQTVAATPSLVEGRLDVENNDRSFQKSLRVVVMVEGKDPVTETEWVLVTGHVAPEGADFVTFTSTEFPMYILRDPPGDKSSAYLQEGYKGRTSVFYFKNVFGIEYGTKTELQTGLNETFFVGLGAGKITTIRATGGFELENMQGVLFETESALDIMYSTTSKYSTSSGEDYIGEEGDVFVGAGLNYVFSEVREIGVDEETCVITRSTELGYQPDGIATTFAYTERYIERVLIPQLKRSKADAEAGGDQESAEGFQIQVDNWAEMLAENTRLKVGAEVAGNRSFSAGADFEYTAEHGTTLEFTCKLTLTASVSEAAVLELKFPSFESTTNAYVKIHNTTDIGLADFEEEWTKGVGYNFSDDDDGDHFTVNIGYDNRYPSPVFDVLAGVSSCPHEPWPDPNPGPDFGQARMLRRDVCEMHIRPSPVQGGIPKDEAAVFTLDLVNNSETHETREYVLREVTTSNPGGAIIKANGQGITSGLSYAIEPDAVQEVTLTVERGPCKYRYEDLEVMLYSECDEVQKDAQKLTVYFDAPCSDVTMIQPEPGWAFNTAAQDTSDGLELLLADYEMLVGETTKLNKVGGQYRRMGTGLQGPGPWTDICVVDPDTLSESTVVLWPIPSDPYIYDGVYEVRAFTQCGGGLGYSAVAAGTIDRKSPEVFGTPQPSDGELCFGEDIRIAFDELIDCMSIDTSHVTLFYLSGPDSGTTIPTETLCDGKRLVLCRAGADMDGLEDMTIGARVSGITDLIGNPMEGTATWQFHVKRSDFTWTEGDLVREVPFRNPGTITAYIVNGTDNDVTDVGFDLLPPWIVEVDPAHFDMPPGATQEVDLVLDETLALGEYEETVRAIAEMGPGEEDDLITDMDIYLSVICQEPDWEFYPGDYEHTMTIVANLRIGETLSSDPDDKVVALVANQIRGVALVDSLTNLAFLTVYSNRTSGETVRFQVWDNDDCMVYNSTSERHAFVADERIGSPGSPVTLTAVQVLPENVQTIPLEQGWDWFSINLQGVDMNVNGVLSDLVPDAGDVIKSQTSYAEFDPVMGWTGTLQLIDNVSGYMINLSEPGTILLEGSCVDPSLTPVPYSTGWNWIGYLPSMAMAPVDALSDLTGVFSDGDVVKGEEAFAQYESGAWPGSLVAMAPGECYKLYIAKSPGHGGTFTYPGSCPTAAPEVAGVPEGGADEAADLSGPEWNFDARAYQYNMTVTAVLKTEGEEWRSEGDIIAAFAGEECRGVARPVYLSATNTYVAFLMVYSNAVSGEDVTFKAYLERDGSVYSVAETISYEMDGSLGTLRQPAVLNTDAFEYKVPGSGPNIYSLSQNVPNPFSGGSGTLIHFTVAVPGAAEVRIFDVRGRLIRRIVTEAELGDNYVTWDGRSNGGRLASSGVYFYQLRMGTYASHKKMLLAD